MKTALVNEHAAIGKTVEKVRESDTGLAVHFTDGSVLVYRAESDCDCDVDRGYVHFVSEPQHCFGASALADLEIADDAEIAALRGRESEQREQVERTQLANLLKKYGPAS